MFHVRMILEVDSALRSHSSQLAYIKKMSCLCGLVGFPICPSCQHRLGRGKNICREDMDDDQLGYLFREGFCLRGAECNPSGHAFQSGNTLVHMHGDVCPARVFQRGYP